MFLLADMGSVVVGWGSESDSENIFGEKTLRLGMAHAAMVEEHIIDI